MVQITGGVTLSGGLTFAGPAEHTSVTTFSNVKALLNFETDTGDQFTENDDSDNSATIYSQGTGRQTSLKKFGNAAGQYTSYNQYISVRPGSGTFANTSWAIECWYNTGSGSGTISSSKGIFGLDKVFSAETTSGGKVRLDIHQDTGYSGSSGNGSTDITNNTWHHIAVTYDGSDFRLFLNGTEEVSASITGNLAGNEHRVIFMADADGSGDSSGAGYVDEIRMVAGDAVYTADFTPLDEAFPTS